MLLTPFQFSSNKLQYTNAITSGLQPAGNTSNIGLVGDLAQTVLSWHEMWVNPSNLRISTQYKQTTQHTAGSIVTFHYRRDLTQIQASGYVGWVAIQSDMEAMQSAMFGALRGGVTGMGSALKNAGTYGTSSVNLTSGVSGVKSAGKNIISSLKQGALLQNNRRNLDDLTQGSRLNKLNNSPRKFLQRLRDLADEPMYYIDDEGCEHYNIKYIKMFTKQYPYGVICEGWFRSFEVPEAADDAQTVQYQFEFIVENMKPVTMLQRVAGMFSGIGSAAGGVAGLL